MIARPARMAARVLVAVALLLAAPGLARRALGQIPGSASYRVNGPVLDAGGGRSTSAGYSMWGCVTFDPSGSAVSASYRVQVGCGASLLLALPGDDDDGDGVAASIEDGVDPSHDGNSDGIRDAIQPDVASLQTPAGNWLTLELLGPSGCVQLENVQGYSEATAGGGVTDDLFDYPYGLVGFEVACASATVRVYFHGAAAIPSVYRKYGITSWAGGSPGPIGWYTLTPTPTYGIAGGVPYAEFTLVDNTLGDDLVAIDRIGDQGGPGQGTNAIPALGGAGLAALIALLALAGALALGRRHQ